MTVPAASVTLPLTVLDPARFSSAPTEKGPLPSNARAFVSVKSPPVPSSWSVPPLATTTEMLVPREPAFVAVRIPSVTVVTPV